MMPMRANKWLGIIAVGSLSLVAQGVAASAVSAASPNGPACGGDKGDDGDGDKGDKKG